MDLTKYFDKLYCINLDRRPDRWEQSLLEFSKYGIININRYPAVDGKLLENTHGRLAGELGITKTHLNIIKEAKECNYTSILIMEDDVVFADDILDVDDYIKEVPEDWDMMYFGAGFNKGEAVINGKIATARRSYGLHCVAIKNTCYDLILSKIGHMEMAVDEYYASFNDSGLIKSYFFHPNIAMQRNGYSDIKLQEINNDYHYRRYNK